MEIEMFAQIQDFRWQDSQTFPKLLQSVRATMFRNQTTLWFFSM